MGADFDSTSTKTTDRSIANSGGQANLKSRILRVLPRVLTLLSILILISIGLILTFSHPRFQMSTLVLDDGGYYMAIARNYASGLGYTFDRVNATNGYNPLLPMLLIPLYRILGNDLDLVTCFRIATLTTWLFLAAGLYPFRQLTRRLLVTFAFPATWRELAVAAATLFYAGAMSIKGLYALDAFLVLGLGYIGVKRG